jgi:hypothetical protein
VYKLNSYILFGTPLVFNGLTTLIRLQYGMKWEETTGVKVGQVKGLEGIIQ